jgi:hypothetical protein
MNGNVSKRVANPGGSDAIGAADSRNLQYRGRARKPLIVPIVAALIGLAIYFLGIALASVDLSALGAILILWGVSSSSILILVRWRRARRRAAPSSPH